MTPTAHRGRVIKNILPNLDINLETDRLVLEPILESHAQEMRLLLADPKLHTYVPTDPPTIDKLRSQYQFWEARISPSEDELWLNWIGRLKSSGQVIGHFQAGAKSNGEASIAYTIGKRYQRQGFAYEGLTTVIEFLFTQIHVAALKAWIDTRNDASIALVKKLGMTQIDFIPKADHFKGSDSDEYVFEIKSNSIT